MAGADVSYDAATGRFFAAVVLLAWPGLEVQEIARARGSFGFPYVPGLLSFRELPPLLRAFRRLGGVPDLILCDGQGLAHPRFLGLACHLGLFLQVPTLGCAKSILVGHHPKVSRHRGACAPLTYRGRRVGTALRTREGVREMIVSPGHLISVSQSAQWAMQCTRRFRMPEPTRLADREVGRMRREELLVDRRPGAAKRLC
ncbi:MAG: endonuclease V [Acidobacteria bacterium]|nr:endonuclease V [Acidobacteriota bacterium]